ncbi:hypothetical protein M3J09_002728 [Ascochyta lentis]
MAGWIPSTSIVPKDALRAHLQRIQLTEQTPFELSVRSIRAVEVEQTSTAGQSRCLHQVDTCFQQACQLTRAPRFIAAKGQTSSSLSNG